MLEQYENVFRKIVLTHIADNLSKEQWVHFRALSLKSNGTVGPASSMGASILPDALFDEFSSIDSISVKEVLATRVGVSACTIDFIENAPVYFIEKAGIYLWGPTDSKFSYSLWLTAPAYPPGW